MVAYPDRFDCLCMAGSFSKRRAGEERDFCKFVVIKHLSYPVFVRAEQADKGEAGIFDWRGDGNHFHSVFVACVRDFQGLGKDEEISCPREHFFGAYPVSDNHQRGTGKNDWGAGF